MTLSPIEAVDLLRFADALSQRLQQASVDLSRRRGLEREKQWLDQAGQLLAEVLGQSTGLLDRARALPELAELREELAGPLQGAWVDALEKLLAGITFHVSSRSPIIEALYPTQKLAPLRRAPTDAVRKFQSDFEKRLKGGYVTRMLGSDEFAFAQPVIEGVREAYARWQSCFAESEVPEAEAAAIREALRTGAGQLDLATRQARHLAEAALAPLPGVFEEHQLGTKPKKRARPSTPASVAANEAAPEEEAIAPDAAVAAEQPTPAPAPEDVASPPEMGSPAVKAPRRRKAGARAETS
jgi:hypothetical protein